VDVSIGLSCRDESGDGCGGAIGRSRVAGLRAQCLGCGLDGAVVGGRLDDASHEVRDLAQGQLERNVAAWVASEEERLSPEAIRDACRRCRPGSTRGSYRRADAEVFRREFPPVPPWNDWRAPVENPVPTYELRTVRDLMDVLEALDPDVPVGVVTLRREGILAAVSGWRISSVDVGLDDDGAVETVWLVSACEDSADPPAVTWRSACGAVAVVADGDEVPPCCR
jgi:hypothetical protein